MFNALLTYWVKYKQWACTTSRNSTSFTRPFLTGRRARAGHETNISSLIFPILTSLIGRMEQGMDFFLPSRNVTRFSPTLWQKAWDWGATGAGCKVMLMLGLHMRRGTAHAGCFHNTQWKKLKPKLLMAKWLGLSATVNIRVRARNKGWLPCFVTNTFVFLSWLRPGSPLSVDTTMSLVVAIWCKCDVMWLFTLRLAGTISFHNEIQFSHTNIHGLYANIHGLYANIHGLYTNIHGCDVTVETHKR